MTKKDQKAFSITHSDCIGAKGFQLTFENGWTVSVQWGVGNYCDHHGSFDLDSMAEVAKDSNTAEVWRWDKHGDSHEDVRGYLSVDQVVDYINETKGFK